MSNRKKTPKTTEINVLLKSRRRCCSCFFLNGDNNLKKGQIAHLDGDPSNDNEDNLAFLCLDHHDEYDSQTSQSKGVTIEEIKHYRNELYNTFQNAQNKNNDAEIEDVVGKLKDRSYLVKGKSYTLLSIFLDTAKELASGCQLAYYGVLLQDYFGIRGNSGWAGLRKTLGFEANKIFGELIILGLWRPAPGSKQKDELYCLSDLGLEVARRLDLEINYKNGCSESFIGQQADEHSKVDIKKIMKNKLAEGKQFYLPNSIKNDELMTKVFISYAKEDYATAEKLYRALKAVPNIDPWLDKECLKPGMKWRPAIRKEIRESEFFLALFSKNSSNRRGFVHTELNEALEILKEIPEGKIFLIPIRLEECDPPHESLREIQYVDFFPDIDKGINKIIDVINPVSKTNVSKTRVPTGYEYRCGIVDIDSELPNLRQIAERMNSIQNFFLFTCASIPSIQTQKAVVSYKGVENLSVGLIPKAFYDHKQYLNVDLVACLTKYSLSFERGGEHHYNYFSMPSTVDDRFMFLSTHLLYNFTKQANCTFEKGIAYIMISQLLVYFTDCRYHETKECLMDFCQKRSDMVKGLKKMRLCPECLANVKNTKLKEAVLAILDDEMIV